MTLSDLDSDGPAFIVIAIIAFTMIFLQHLINKHPINKEPRGGSDLISFQMSMIGTLYAVTLGLIMVDASNKFDNTKKSVSDEANKLLQIYAISSGVPDAHGIVLRRTIKSYANEVRDIEWGLLGSTRYSKKAKSDFHDLIQIATTIKVDNDEQSIIIQEIMDLLMEAWSSRRGRIDFEGYVIPRIEWVGLISGGIVVLLFPFFVARRSDGLPGALMTGLYTFIVTTNLYLVFAFDSPFTGSLRVPNTSFSNLIEYIDTHPPETNNSGLVKQK